MYKVYSVYCLPGKSSGKKKDFNIKLYFIQSQLFKKKILVCSDIKRVHMFLTKTMCVFVPFQFKNAKNKPFPSDDLHQTSLTQL